jgi:Ca2+-binding EF-hand superfamily protein
MGTSVAKTQLPTKDADKINGTYAKMPLTAVNGVAEKRLSRTELRQQFNDRELHIDELFDQFDTDKSGFLERRELVELLKETSSDGEEPSQDEIDWIISISCKHTDKMRKKEVLTAMKSWYGYQNLPTELVQAFDEYDINKDGFLEASEFKLFLTSCCGGQVTEFEAQEIIETADLLSDGKIGKYELLGAVGAWYISVGRRPTHAMALAFAANNRTVSTFHKYLHFFIASTCVPTAYFPLAAAWYSRRSSCTLNLDILLWVDGSLWLVLTVLMVMKVYWVQLLNKCLLKAKKHETHMSAGVLQCIAWVFVGTEVLCLMILCVVEGYGAYWALLEEKQLGEEEKRGCNVGVDTPWDIPLSMKTFRLRKYPSFLDFCKTWFTFNLIFNAACLVFYYAFIAYRFYQLYQSDRELTEGIGSQNLGKALSENDGKARTVQPPAPSSPRPASSVLSCCSRGRVAAA